MVGSDDAGEWKLQLVLSFWPDCLLCGVFLPSAPRLDRYAAVVFGTDRNRTKKRTLFCSRSPLTSWGSPMSSERPLGKERVVSRDPDVLGGELVFAGTRVPVQTLIDYLKSGETLDRFLEGFPTVEWEQAEASLEMTLKDAETHA